MHDLRVVVSFTAVLDLQSGAKGFQLSNPPVLECCCLLTSLQVFEQTSMSQLVCKSRLLTAYLELLLETDLVTSQIAGEGKGTCRWRALSLFCYVYPPLQVLKLR